MVELYAEDEVGTPCKWLFAVAEDCAKVEDTSLTDIEGKGRCEFTAANGGMCIPGGFLLVIEWRLFV